MESSSVCLVVKPKLWMMSAEKLLPAALGTSMAATTTAMRYVCGSTNTSRNCSFLNRLFSMPVLFSRSRSIAQIFSVWLSREDMGLSGRKAITAMPTTTVTSPKMRNSSCHERNVSAE